MGNSHSPSNAMLQLDPYIWDDGGSLKFEYNPGLHPGTFLLPPEYLLQYDTLP